ncbi:MAG TPA: penicillin-binding transpeptidase domain-containing protein [bacterium]|nr:penicillin-binding transpeptidase domain-containing protein [bacterium]
MRSASPARIKLVRTAVVGAFAIVAARAAQLALHADPRLSRLAERQYNSAVELAPKRGTIFDRRGNVLAQSVDVDSIYAEPRRLSALSPADRRRLAAELARSLRMESKIVLERLEADRGFVWLKRRVSPEIAKEVARLGLEGIGSVKESKRYYPNVELAGQLLGFAGLDSEGLEGLEKEYDPVLKSDAKRFERPRDARGRAYADGASVFVGEEDAEKELILTLDQQIQFLAEAALRKGVANSQAKAGFVIVEDPRTGEILAMAGQPTYNPNAFWNATADAWRDRPVTDVFEPGSTLKPVLLSAAFDNKVVKPSDTFFCENGTFDVADETIHDSKKHGWLTVAQILQVSSNIGMIKVGRLVGKDAYFQTLKDFGFGSKTGVDLPGEAAGLIQPRARWSQVTLASTSFGHGISVTGVQLVNAISAIANGGILMQPFVVRRVQATDGTIARDVEPVPLRRVMTEETAKTLVELMEGVVSPQGTGAAAGLPDYRVAGKTGTAQKVDLVSGGYSDKRIASFVGFAPASNPRLTILVVIDEPKTSAYGGVVAAPVFREIADGALRYLAVPPDREGGAVAVATVADDQAGEGFVAERVTPKKPDSAKLAAVKALAAKKLAAAKQDDANAESAAEEAGEDVIPDFRGLTLRAALRVAEPRRLELEVKGSGRASRQEPAAGTKVQAGTKVTVWFENAEASLEGVAQ